MFIDKYSVQSKINSMDFQIDWGLLNERLTSLLEILWQLDI